MTVIWSFIMPDKKSPPGTKDYAKRDEQRRARYATDPLYREDEGKRAREAYAARTGRTKVNHATEALKKLRVVREPITPARLSSLMGRGINYVSSMIREERWPAPGEGGYYTLAQTRALLTVFADHCENYANYRSDHTQTKDRLFDVMKGPQ